jgi:cell division protein FtsW
MKNYFDNYYDWWKNIDKYIFSLILILFFLGLFFSLVSTSLIASGKLDTNSYYFFIKHFIFIIFGITILIIFSFLKEEFLFKASIILFSISFITLVLVPFIGVEVKGSKRWIDLDFLPRFQPIEIIKPFFIITVSTLLCINKNNLYFKYFLSSLILLPTLLLLISQPDLGQTLLIAVVWLTIIFVSGINIYLFFIFFIFVSLTAYYLIFFVSKFEYIKFRFLSFINSSEVGNYQAEKASDAIISGGFFGKGIGEGTLNSKIPEAHTDYIVSVVSEEFGAIIVIIIILLYLIFAYKIIQKINLINKEKIKLILIGSISLILLQTFVHIGVNIRLLPTTGMTLPYLSYGGSSIISTAIISGIILNLTKRKVN